MSTWNYITILLCLLLLAFTCWNEWKRMDKSRLILRLLASFVAIACFACLTLPITRKVRATNIQGDQALLLTEGFSKDSVNGFLSVNKNTTVYATDKNLIATSTDYKIKFVSIAELALLKNELSAIHVYGYGLDKDELNVLPPSFMIFHPSKPPDGIAFVNWQHKIKTGDQLRVQGSFLNSSSHEAKLIFSGYGTNLDTAIIPANKNANFELSAVPKQLGKAAYMLTAIAGKDTLEKEPVPFEIEQPDRLKVLILAASPGFENKFLKSWLSENSYALVTRTTISKNKYERTFLNTPQVSFNGITSAFLQDFDVVIADASELAAISKSELAAIESQVAKNGTGLIVKADSASARNSFYSKRFPVHQGSDDRKDISLYIPVSNQFATVLTSERPVYIRPQPGTKTLIEDKQSNIIVSSTIYGSGKLLCSTLDNTFTWMLSGDNKTYQAFWSYLLEEASAKTSVDKSWSISPAYPYANRAVKLNYTSNHSETPQVQVGKDFVHFIQNPDLPFQWQGSYWPQESGWQPVMHDNKSTFWWYAYASDDWKTMVALQKTKATLQSITANVNERSKDEQNIPVRLPVSKKYFFMLFLCCAGFLWIEKKL